MSRTYRFKNSHHEKSALWNNSFKYYGENEWELVRGYLDPLSNEGRKRLAEFHADAKRHVMIWNGPGWFHRLYSQKPHRMRARKELLKFFRNPEHEVVIENKPPREYWW